MLSGVKARIRTKHGFVRVWGSAFAIAAAFFLLWRFGHYGNLGFKVLLILLAAAGGAVWSHLMWQVLKRDLAAKDER